MSETIYEHMGGIEALRRAVADLLRQGEARPRGLEPLFGAMPDEHPERVALWLAEVFGGPREYTAQRGGYPAMVLAASTVISARHSGARWAELLYASLDEAGIQDDERFRRTFRGYVEWGTRIAQRNSQIGFTPPREAHVPTWPWSPDPE